ncbi:hypothetical protein BGZ94_002792 [Podila epigama]|nr:hypothetical protein BGZ94_002792 [Podila epigama]
MSRASAASTFVTFVTFTLLTLNLVQSQAQPAAPPQPPPAPAPTSPKPPPPANNTSTYQNVAYAGTSILADGALYIYGGVVQFAAQNVGSKQFLRLDLTKSFSTNSSETIPWQPLSGQLNYKMVDCIPTRDGRQLILAGNRDNEGALAHIYDIEGKTWTTTPNLPGFESNGMTGYKRANLGGALDPRTGLVYMYGGFGHMAFLNEVSVLDTSVGEASKMRWTLTQNQTAIPTLYEPIVTYLPTVKKVMVMGGCDVYNIITGLVKSCAPLSNGYYLRRGGSESSFRIQQVQLMNAPVPRYHACRTVLKDGRVFIQGGQTPEGVFFGDAWILDPKTLKWSEQKIQGPVEAMTRAAHSCEMGPNGQLIVVGGFVRTGNTTNFVMPSMAVINTETWTWTTEYKGAPVSSIWTTLPYEGPDDGSIDRDDDGGDGNGTSPDDDSGMSSGAKAGLGIGIVAALLAIGLGVFFFQRQRKRTQEQEGDVRSTSHIEKGNESGKGNGNDPTNEYSNRERSHPVYLDANLNASRNNDIVGTSPMGVTSSPVPAPAPAPTPAPASLPTPTSTSPLNNGLNPVQHNGSSPSSVRMTSPLTTETLMSDALTIKNTDAELADAALAAALLQAEDKAQGPSRSVSTRTHRSNYSNGNSNSNSNTVFSQQQTPPQVPLRESLRKQAEGDKDLSTRAMFVSGPQSVPEDEAVIERFSPGVAAQTSYERNVGEFEQGLHRYDSARGGEEEGEGGIIIGGPSFAAAVAARAAQESHSHLKNEPEERNEEVLQQRVVRGPQVSYRDPQIMMDVDKITNMIRAEEQGPKSPHAIVPTDKIFY